MSKNISIQSIKKELIKLGIRRGDLVFITMDLSQVGYFNTNRNKTLADWLAIFMDILGEEGGLIMAAYTETFIRFRKDPKICFTKTSKSTAGVFPNYLIKHPIAIRSTHPTHSCVGFGINIAEIMNSHNEKSTSYSIMKSIMNMGGKHLMLGTLDKKNAPQSMHLVQEDLGYTNYSPYKWLFQSYYINERGERKLYTKTDYGGCSAGGYKLLGPLIVNNAIQIGKVGNATSAVIDSKKSYIAIKKILAQDKKYILCDDYTCTQCYGNFFYNGRKTIFFLFRKLKFLWNTPNS